jgi:CO dehydrogenase/acetyl-CoA synthase gamma subunit (corrinoid Fe-S protein)
MLDDTQSRQFVKSSVDCPLTIFGLDLVVIQTVGASLQLLSGGQFNADFVKKIITDRQSFNITDND